VRALIYDRLTRALFVRERFVAGAQPAGLIRVVKLHSRSQKTGARLLRRTTLFPRRFRKLVAGGTCVYFKLIPFSGGSADISRHVRDHPAVEIFHNIEISKFSTAFSNLRSFEFLQRESKLRESRCFGFVGVARMLKEITPNSRSISFESPRSIDLFKSTTRRLRWIHCSVNFRRTSDAVALRSTREIRFS